MKEINFKTDKKNDSLEFKYSILTSEQYMECQSLCRKYISNLASLIKEYSINDSSISSCYLFYDLLKEGLLSYNKEENFKDYKYDYDSISTMYLLSARVMTGKSTCRHKASMLTLLLYEMGYKVANIRTYTNTKSFFLENPKKINKIISKDFANHLVTGVIDNDGKYIFDPTNKGIVSYCNLEINDEKIWNSLLTSSDLYYRLCKNKHEWYNQVISENVDLFLNKDIKPIDYKYINYITDETGSLLDKNKGNFLDFWHENEELLNQIVNLYIHLIPYADSKKEYKKELKELKRFIDSFKGVKNIDKTWFCS